MMRALKSFGAFWYDFIVGDERDEKKSRPFKK